MILMAETDSKVKQLETVTTETLQTYRYFKLKSIFSGALHRNSVPNPNRKVGGAVHNTRKAGADNS